MAESFLDGDEEDGVELDADQKLSLATWFLLNAPPEEIQQVAEDVQKVLSDSVLFDQACREAFPKYNVEQMISLELPNGTGQVIVSRFAELDESRYLDPRTSQVATVDHVKQICKSVRAASDDELPSVYVEEYRSSVDAELLKYVEDAYPRGSCSVYCTRGKDFQEGHGNIQLTVVISNSSFSPKNYRGGRWRSVWKIDIYPVNDTVEMRGKINVDAHYFEEGNVQLNTEFECTDSTIFQDPKETGVSIVAAIRHHESEYLSSLDDKYANLSDTTFKDLRRKLPVTRTQFAWDKALQLSLNREAARQLSAGRRTTSR
ncbi:unnamed protein product [Calypogeia fissa]